MLTDISELYDSQSMHESFFDKEERKFRPAVNLKLN